MLVLSVEGTEQKADPNAYCFVRTSGTSQTASCPNGFSFSSTFDWSFSAPSTAGIYLVQYSEHYGDAGSARSEHAKLGPDELRPYTVGVLHVLPAP